MDLSRDRLAVEGNVLVFAAADAALPAAALTEGERAVHDRLPGDHARRVWRTGRRALRQVLQALGHGVDTSCVRFPHHRLALSYGEGVAVAVGLSEDHRPRPVLGVGVDIQRCRTDAELPSHAHARARLFLSAGEQSWLVDQPTEALAGHLERLWTVKEAAFKADPANVGRQLGDYTVQDPSSRVGQATSRVDGLVVPYRTDRAGSSWLTVALSHPPSPQPSRPGGSAPYEHRGP